VPSTAAEIVDTVAAAVSAEPIAPFPAADGEGGDPHHAPKVRRRRAASPPSAGPPIAPFAYTIATAVQASGISRSRLYELAAEGRLPFRKCGKSVLILADDLHELLRSLPPAPIRQRKDAA
jgi:excisionase family DNA binding protein